MTTASGPTINATWAYTQKTTFTKVRSRWNELPLPASMMLTFIIMSWKLNMLHSKLLAIFLCFFLCTTPLARADIVSPGRKRIRSEVVINFGGLKDQCWSTYGVRNDDTLSSISQALLGDVSRWPEIARANPGIEDRELEVGSLLEIPPRENRQQGSKEKNTQEAWRIYAWFDGTMSHNKPILASHGLVLRGPRYSGQLIAVPHRQKQALAESLSSEDRDSWLKVRGLARSSKFGGTREVRLGDPTTTMRTTVTIDSIRDGEIKFSTSTTGLDEQGNEVTWLASNRLPLLAISGLGAILLLLIVLRRRKNRSSTADVEQS